MKFQINTRDPIFPSGFSLTRLTRRITFEGEESGNYERISSLFLIVRLQCLSSGLLIKVGASTSGGAGFRFIVFLSVLGLAFLRRTHHRTHDNETDRTNGAVFILLIVIPRARKRGSRVQESGLVRTQTVTP